MTTIQPNGRCCVIKDHAGDQIAICIVGGLSQASELAARRGADTMADQEHYTGVRKYVESEVVVP
jgi:hypothetical protein